MILVLSGEGPTDIGTRKLTEGGWQFVPGPMTAIIDRLLGNGEKLDYSILEIHASGAECVCFLNEGQLSARHPERPLFMPRGLNRRGVQIYRAAAYLLGQYAQEVAIERGAPTIAILFRDADTTNSSRHDAWRSKFDSMLAGFRAAEFRAGVPMVPQPKSEAWMLCGLRKRNNAAEDCSWLEEESGNDASPQSLKKQLADHLGHVHPPSAEEQAELVRSGQIDPEQIDLPSFLAFREALDAAFANAITLN